LVAALFAHYSIREQRKIEQRKAAHDFILLMATDRTYQDAVIHLLQMHNSGLFEQPEELDALIIGADGESIRGQNRVALRELSNFYEVLAISIRHSTIDEKIMRQYARGIVATNWQRMEPFISGVRHKLGGDKVASNFEALVTRWSKG